MASLYQAQFRPACVVSALPKRFRDSLARELKGAVAISTCPVSELEGTVRRRGATIAVVGVCEGTIEVAERLSHTEGGVKVFLAHYEEGSSARLNGFAGVFDLRAEAKRLAAAIKGAVPNIKPPIFPTSPFVGPGPSLLARFIELQKKVGNPAALSDGILEHLLNLAGGTEGFLLQPEKMDETTFRVTASRGENMPPIGRNFPLDASGISSAGTFEAQDWSDPEVALTGFDHFALPIQSRGRPCAVLVCNNIDRSESFDQFLEATKYLFDQAAEREQKSFRQQLIATARSSAIDHSGWLLADGDGRVIHREGLGSFKLRRNRIEEPRLQDLVYRSFHVETSSIELEGRKISARTLISDQGLFCLMEIDVPAAGVDENSLRRNDPFLALRLIRSSCAESGDEKALVDELLADLVEGKTVNSATVLTSLQKLGVKVELGEEEFQPAQLSRVGLVLLMATKELRAPISATLRLTHGRWILTAEISEKNLGSEAFDWNSANLFRAALEVAGYDRGGLRTAVFGFQLTGSPKS